MIVCKFGGTTTTSQSALHNIQKLVKDDQRTVLVFSAIGKTENDDNKLTDLLIEYTIKKEKTILIKIYNKLKYLCDLTNVKFNILYYLKKYQKKYLLDNDSEYFISRGEFLTSKILSKYLNIIFIPAEKIIYFEKDKLCYDKIEKKLNYYLKKYKKILIPGFYGISDGKIKLFSRGGGDITGAVIARVIKAKYYENYTDENGIKEVNPKFVKNARTIKYMSIDDCQLFSSCDAKVLHKDVCKILKYTNVVIKVKNIFSPSKNFTTIDHNNHACIFVCFKCLGDYCQIVVKTTSLDKLKKFYDNINYISKKYVYICTDIHSVNKMIKQIYFNIAK